MVELITRRVWEQITSAATASRRPSQIAVAYFGERGPSLLPLRAGSSVIVDASIPTIINGGTSPNALRRLQQNGIEIFSVTNLHAKVYAFDDVAYVGSANASLNSADNLIEAVVKLDDVADIELARSFVSSLAITRLSSADLVELSQYYRRTAQSRFDPRQASYSTLLMDLTNEQGGGRESQVQPPKAAWENFFGLIYPTTRLPKLTLTNQRTGERIERPVVRHRAVHTIEISEARLPRPAILLMRKTERNNYTYDVVRPNDRSFIRLDNALNTIPNPLNESSRRWVLV